MAASISVRKVASRADFKAFFEFPWVLYRNDPNWVPPLLSMRRALLDQQKHPSWEYMEGDYFVAWRGEQAVGTIAAYINHRHNEFHSEHIGWFGAFEVYDDQEAAAALLNTAADWVRARGYDAIRGPQTFTTHDECGLLVDGFTQPVLLMPYNPPYYERLIEAAGFVSVKETVSFTKLRDDPHNEALLERLRRISQGVMKRNKIAVRPLDRRNLKREFVLFKELYNQAWEKNWGFVPMTERELDALVKSLGQFFDPDLAFFAEVDGVPAGFIMAVPDFNAVLKAANPRPGVPEIITLLRALWAWRVAKVIRITRIPLLGVAAPFRNKGVDAVLAFNILDQLVRGPYESGDFGWILKDNTTMMNLAHSFGSRIYKTYRFYEKAF